MYCLLLGTEGLEVFFCFYTPTSKGMGGAVMGPINEQNCNK